MSADRRERLAWMEKRLALKHKDKSPQAIKRLAETLLIAEDTIGDQDDEFEFNRRVEHERKLDLEYDECEKRRLKEIEAEDKPLYKRKHRQRIEAFANNPLYKALFNGKKPNNTVDTSKFVGVNTRDKLGRTKLHWAAEAGDLDECKRLRKKEKIDVSIKDNRHATAYMIAVREGHDHVAEYLLEPP